MNGKTVRLSSLDACNGIFSATPEFPHGIYHYVLTDDASSRSSMRCYHGVVAKSLLQSASPPRGQAPPDAPQAPAFVHGPSATAGLARLTVAVPDC
jgi:hypothetical protein